MTRHSTYLSSLPLHPPTGEVEGDVVSLRGEAFYRIANVDRMESFFMSVVSASDHWMFISSEGGLTAGRRNADHAIFPYGPEDRIHDDSDHTGSQTVVRVVGGDGRRIWEPFSRRFPGAYRRSRHLYKSIVGDEVVFEEVNHDLQLAFRYGWSPSERFGWVRRSEIENRGTGARTLELLDGVRNLLPWGVEEAFQSRFSVLGDAYKQNELDVGRGLGIYALSSVPGDSTEPAEALRATVCWSTARPEATRLVSSLQLDAFRRGADPEPEARVRGRRGAYLVVDALDLEGGASREWLTVVDTGYGPSEVARLQAEVLDASDPQQAVYDDLAKSREHLIRIVAGADGLQRTADRMGSIHHFANVLFNVMRGGTFESGYTISTDDLSDYLSTFNREVARRHRDLPSALGAEVRLDALRDSVATRDDPELERLVTEYLPISFSRRHGDPSRPWNRFSIELRDDDGSRILSYEGNWRDIFQNWEALCLSFPAYFEGVIAKFLNTSTADGYNPYRVTREGYDWETPAPDEPWANLGYWGDHQLVYLLKLLEWSRAHQPGRLEGLLTEARFVYADVPYNVRPYEELLEDPRDAIEYDTEREARIAERVEGVGFDGRYLGGDDGRPQRANLTEKLLVPLLTKIGTFVPGAGFWMNTQRPEWNDANNALAGYGASMVTACYARRYAALVEDLLGGLADNGVELRHEVAEWLERTHGVLADHEGLLDRDEVGGRERRKLLDGVAGAASDYRAGLYASGLGDGTRSVSVADVRTFLRLVTRFLDHSIALARRDDGLYHAYTILDFGGDEVGVEHLYPMLEGQVAVLSSGALHPAEASAVMRGLRESAMYREDQHSYTLYPDRELPSFLEKNRVPEARVADSHLVQTLLEAGNTAVVERDVAGGLHFNPDFSNGRDLEAALRGLRDEGYGDLVDAEGEMLVELFDEIFDHARFTGRSGTFFGYEGLGSIYWHMVSKLLLAVQENAFRAARDGDDDAFEALAHWYYDVRAGLGFNKAPEVFGAVPTDPYSHTPGHAGAKQPGMTGQVKEEVLTRLGELGLHVVGGRVVFDPVLLRRSEFLDEAEDFAYRALDGAHRSLELEPGTLAFTYCQVPVVYRLAGDPGIEVHRADGSSTSFDSLELDAETSAELFGRTGRIARVEVALRPGLDG